MTERQKQSFIENELHHELRCLLGSATLWQAFKQAGAGYNVVAAQDSAFAHARILFEFFTSDSKNKNILRVTEFGPQIYKSQIYSVWKESLNRHVLHLNHRRLKPTNSKSGKELKNQVMTFVTEIMRLWDKLEADQLATDYRKLLIDTRIRAVGHARNDADGRTEPIL